MCVALGDEAVDVPVAHKEGIRIPPAEQDLADAEALYAVLEEQVLPAYYERDDAGLPQRWIALMRESIAELGPRFGTARMAAEYVERLYLPAHEGATRAPSRVA